MCKMILGISWIRYCIFAVGKFCLFKNNNKKGYNYAKTFLSFSAGIYFLQLCDSCAKRFCQKSGGSCRCTRYVNDPGGRYLLHE